MQDFIKYSENKHLYSDKIYSNQTDLCIAMGSRKHFPN